MTAELNWLAQHCFVGVVRREFDWVFTFDHGVALVAECLWRLLENDRIRFTSADEGQLFGLPTPVDAVAEINSRLTDAFVTAVELKSGTLDLRIAFNTGHVLELLPESSGYEAWNATCSGMLIVAAGGGELVVYNDSDKHPEC